MVEFDITKHVLVPQHIKLSEEEKHALLQHFNISIKQLPKIINNDPAIKHLDVKIGDVIKVIRKSPTVGQTEYYRMVI